MLQIRQCSVKTLFWWSKTFGVVIFFFGSKRIQAWEFFKLLLKWIFLPKKSQESPSGCGRLVITRASFCCTKILKKLHLFLKKVALKSCIYFERKLQQKVGYWFTHHELEQHHWSLESTGAAIGARPFMQCLCSPDSGTIVVLILLWL